ncbi:MAG: cysteine desulfurase [Acidobacteria bacterium]|nr:cysteine desulfurase [Acidobacteriota bacterium]
MRRHYFDHNATTPLDACVLAAMRPALEDVFGNASSIHSFGQDAKRLTENARRQIAALFGADAKAIVLTGGGSEADNLAIVGAAGKARHLITSSIEHPAVLASCRRLEERGAALTIVPVGASGLVDPDDVRAALRPDTDLISIMAANNEIGTIQPLAEIGRIAKEAGALFHTDAVQAAGKIPIDPAAWQADLIAVTAHKFYGPKGTGALYVRNGLDVEPLIVGGGQERGRRAGTENVAGIVGLGAAAELALSDAEAESNRLRGLRDSLERSILDRIPDVWVNAQQSPRTPNTASIGFEGIEGEPLVIALDLRGFAVSAGSACSSGAVEPSHVLTAIGLPKRRAKSCIRFSLGRQTTQESVDALVDALEAVVARLRSLAPVSA